MLEKVLWRAMIGRRELVVLAKPLKASLRRRAAQTSYTEYQTFLERPLSPSLTVYKQSVPAISSITNRVTGILLSLGFGAASFATCLHYDLPTLILEMQDAIPGFTYVSKFAVAFPLTCHWLGGARHISHSLGSNAASVEPEICAKVEHCGPIALDGCHGRGNCVHNLTFGGLR
ncbi:Succinate dehydrogenase, cytochrome b556 subunit, partial [Globisporangium splendens]